MATLPLNVKYDPLSFEEYLRPFIAYNQAYENMSNNLDLLDDEATKYSQYIQPGTEAYKTQQQYLSQIKDLNNRLYNEGMNLNLNMDNVRGLRKTFKSQMVPINQAAQKLDELNKTVFQMKIKDPNILVDKMPTIDEIRNNPNATPLLINGKELQQNAMALGAVLAREIDNNPEIRKLGAFVDIVSREGASSEEKLFAFQNLASSPYFQQLFNQYNLGSVTNPQIFQQAMSYMRSGFAMGYTGKTEHKIMEDPIARDERALNAQLEIIRQKKSQPQSQNDGYENTATFTDINYSDNYAQSKYDSDPYIKNQAALSKYQTDGYLINNEGVLELTEKGLDAYNNNTNGFKEGYKSIAKDFGLNENDFSPSDLSVQYNYHKALTKNGPVKSGSMTLPARDIAGGSDEDLLISRFKNVVARTANAKGGSVLYEFDSVEDAGNGRYRLATKGVGKKAEETLEGLAPIKQGGKKTHSITRIAFDPISRQCVITIVGNHQTHNYVFDEESTKEFLTEGAYRDGIAGNYNSMWAGVFAVPKAGNSMNFNANGSNLGGYYAEDVE